MKKRIVSALLSLALVLSMAPMAATAAGTYSDTAGHWAEAAIERFSGYGIVQGNNGKFNPDNYLSRAEMAAIISRLVDLPEAESAGFTDVADSAWYADVINRCAASGIMQGYNGLANPKSNITRQDAIVMLARTLGIEAESDPDLSQYTDADQVSGYAKGYVAAMSDAGIVNGVGNNQVGALRNIKRSEAVTILDRAISAYANEDGQTVADPGDGIVLVVADNVTITGDVDRVIVTPGASGGTVTLTDATVSGDVTVQTDANVVLENTTASSVTVSEGAKAKVSLDADTSVDDVNVSGAGTELQIAGNVGSVTLSDTADNSVVTVAEGGTLQRLYSDSMGSTVIGTAQNITSSSNETMPTQEELPAKVDDGAQGVGTEEPEESTPVESDPVESQNPSQSAGGNAGGAIGGGTLATYNVSFETNGGSAVAQQTVTVGTAVATVAAPTKTGYTFAGWYSNADLTTAYDLTAGVYNNLTLYAAWTPNTYTVSYNSNSGSGTTASGSMTYGVSGTLASSSFTRTGYTFAGWNTAADGNGTAYTAGATVSNLTATNGGTVTLYAQWTPNTYTITFNANGGTGTTSAQTRRYDDGAALTANSFSRAGYGFTGWSTTPNGSVAYTDTQIANLSTGSNVTLYAVWNANANTAYTVNHYYQKTSGGETDDDYELAKTDNLTGVTDTTTNITADSPTGFQAKEFSQVTITGDGKAVINIYYNRESRTVTFDANGGAEGSTATVLYDGTAALPENPTRTGYTFDGWYDNAEGTGTAITALENVTGDRTVYAKWTANTYTVQFNKNDEDADGTTADASMTYGVEGKLTANGFKKIGYIFDGWNTAADGTGTDYTDEQQVSNLIETNGGSLILYAKWTECDHNGNTADSTATCTVGGSFVCSVCGATGQVDANGHDWNEDGKCNNCDATKVNNWKFKLAVSSTVDRDTTTTVSADVYDDYSFIVTMPGTDAKVSPSNAEITASMQNVAGLNVTGDRSHTLPISTGLPGGRVQLSTWLANCYSFGKDEDVGATVAVTIGDAKEFKYEIGGATASTDNSNYTITGKVSSVDDARAAWNELTSHVTSETQGKNNSYITIANGSWLQVGSQVLMFENSTGDLTLDNINQTKNEDGTTTGGMDALIENIRGAVTLTDAATAASKGLAVETEGNTRTVKALLTKGTTLAVGSSVATLDSDATIKVTGLDLETQAKNPMQTGRVFTLAEALGQLKEDAGSADTSGKLYLVMDMIASFDALVGAVDNGTDVSVNVTFGTTQTETPEIDNPNAEQN